MKRVLNIRAWGGCCVVMYALSVLCTVPFFFEVREWSVSTWLLMLTALPVYAFFYTLPAAVLSLAAGLAFRRDGRAAAATLGVLAAGAQLLILADYGLFRNFGFHFNLFVWKLAVVLMVMQRNRQKSRIFRLRRVTSLAVFLCVSTWCSRVCSRALPSQHARSKSSLKLILW